MVSLFRSSLAASCDHVDTNFQTLHVGPQIVHRFHDGHAKPADQLDELLRLEPFGVFLQPRRSIAVPGVQQFPSSCCIRRSIALPRSSHSAAISGRTLRHTSAIRRHS